MLDIRTFLHESFTVGSAFGIEAKVMLWINAGSGQVLALEPRLLAIEGKVQVFGKEHPLELQLALGEPVLDETGVTTGHCTLRIGQEADGEAVYRVEDGSLILLGTVDGHPTRVVLRPDERHSLLDIDGKRKASLRLTAS